MNYINLMLVSEIPLLLCTVCLSNKKMLYGIKKANNMKVKK